MNLFEDPIKLTMFDEPEPQLRRVVCADCFLIIGDVPDNKAAISIAYARHALECSERDA